MTVRSAVRKSFEQRITGEITGDLAPARQLDTDLFNYESFFRFSLQKFFLQLLLFRNSAVYGYLWREEMVESITEPSAIRCNCVSTRIYCLRGDP